MQGAENENENEIENENENENAAKLTALSSQGDSLDEEDWSEYLVGSGTKTSTARLEQRVGMPETRDSA